MELEHELEDLVSRELGALGYELVKLEAYFTGRRKVLRLFIDRPDGEVTIDDCVRATKALGLVLDGVESVPAPYNLEISSPGSARPLTKPAHFARFHGERSRIEYLDEAGGKVTVVGTIAGANDETITVIAEGSECVIPFGKILRANLKPEEPRKAWRGDPGRGRGRKDFDTGRARD